MRPSLTKRIKADARYPVSLAVFALCWLLYAWTAAPGVTLHDSGELITAAHVLGIGHPPGAPTWTLLAKLFTFIPIGSIAYRVHLMSGFFAAISCSLVYLCAMMLMVPNGTRQASVRHHVLAVLSAALLAQSPAFWMKAGQAELYTLNVFFMMLILVLLIHWSRRDPEQAGQHKILILIAALFGLGMGNYMALSFYVPVVVIAVCWRYREILKEVRLLAAMAAAGLAGLAVYLYLPIRSRMNPVIDWGNPETLNHFRIVFSRKRWGELTWSEHSMAFIERWLDSISLTGELGLPALILIAMGLAALIKKERFAAWIMLGFFFIYGIWMMMMQALTPVLNHDLYYVTWYGMGEFHIPLYSVAAPLIAVGAADLLAYVEPKIKALKLNNIPGNLAGMLIALLMVGWEAVPHYKACNLRDYTQPGMLAREVLNSCSTNSWLFAPGDDPQFAVAYTKFVENVRTDVALMTPRTAFFRTIDETLREGATVSRSDLLAAAEGRLDEVIEFRYHQDVPFDPTEVRMFFTKPPLIPNIRSSLFPNQLLFEIMPASLYDAHAQRQYWNSFLSKPHLQPSQTMPHDFMEAMAAMLQHHGDWHYTRREYDLAAYLYERCLAYSEPPRIDVLDRLAFALYELNELEGAYALCKQAITLNETNRTAWMTLARVLVKQGRLDAAAACYESILSFDPDDKEAADNLSFITDKLEAIQ